MDGTKIIIQRAVQSLISDALDEHLDVMPDVDTLADGLEIDSISCHEKSETYIWTRDNETGPRRMFKVKVSEVR